MYNLKGSSEAWKVLEELEKNDSKKANKVWNALGRLANNPRHNSLQTHRFYSETGLNDEKMYEAYVENNTPSAWRILFYYPKTKKGEKQEKTIMIYDLLPHRS